MFRTTNRKPSTIAKAARAQAGMTLLEIMIVLAIIAVVMGFLVGPRVMRMFQDSKLETTKLLVANVVQAQNSWSLSSDNPCPNSLKDLQKYRNSKKTTDAWGSELVMLCGENAPEGSNGFAVLSKGPDKKQGTKDDIKSWDD